MLEAALAEELLGLATSRERAACIVGDLTEQAASRGRGWFWRAVLGVALASFACAFAAGRVRVLWLVAAGFAAWFATYVVVRLGGAALGLQPVVLPAAEAHARPWSVQLYLGATLVLAGIVAGAALGARRPSHGVNACVPLAMFWAAAAIAAPLVDVAAGTVTWRCTLLYVLGLPLLYMLPLLTGGAVGARTRRGRAC